MKFPIVELIPDEEYYDSFYPEMKIPLGKSRYGGPVFDMPPGTKAPENMPFACQFDFAEMAPHDKENLLPKFGHLVVFADITTDKGVVHFFEGDSEELVRVVREHEDNFYQGVLVESAASEVEYLSDRYRPLDDDELDDYDEDDGVTPDNHIWDESAGEDRSKMLGIPYHCQAHEDYILGRLQDDFIVLAQFGSGFNDSDGVFALWIHRVDLILRDFSRCQFQWSQT